MDLEESRQKLIEALRVVRAAFDDGADDWRHRLMRTFREYSLDIGVDRELLDPLQKMLIETDDAILKARRRKDGKRVKRLPLNHSLTRAFAAACVTELKRRGEYQTIPKAEHAVARIAGIERKTLKQFRDELNRGRGPMAVGYSQQLAKIEQWSTFEILSALKRLAVFGK
jgi:hypothetical protein